jgi:hypothetical protein
LATVEHSEKKQKFQKIKNLKWSFHGAANFKSSKKIKTIHLYNIVEKGLTMPALTHSVPQNLMNIHAYHFDILKFIKWSIKAS